MRTVFLTYWTYSAVRASSMEDRSISRLSIPAVTPNSVLIVNSFTLTQTASCFASLSTIVIQWIAYVPLRLRSRRSTRMHPSFLLPPSSIAVMVQQMPSQLKSSSRRVLITVSRAMLRLAQRCGNKVKMSVRHSRRPFASLTTTSTQMHYELAHKMKLCN